MSANVSSTGTVRQLDRRPEPDEQVTEEQAQEPARVARALMTLLRDVAALKRRWWPQRIDYEDIVSTGTSVTPMTMRLAHGFGAPVRWYVVRSRSAGTVTVPLINETTASDSNTLVLDIYYEATLTIRVEEAG